MRRMRQGRRDERGGEGSAEGPPGGAGGIWAPPQAEPGCGSIPAAGWVRGRVGMSGCRSQTVPCRRPSLWVQGQLRDPRCEAVSAPGGGYREASLGSGVPSPGWHRPTRAVLGIPGVPAVQPSHRPEGQPQGTPRGGMLP